MPFIAGIILVFNCCWRFVSFSSTCIVVVCSYGQLEDLALINILQLTDWLHFRIVLQSYHKNDLIIHQLFWYQTLFSMKAVFIISSRPDILFVWEDNDFARHINKVLYEAGFIDCQLDMTKLDHGAMAQYFSPMIASLTYMNDIGNPYSSITCKDGTMFVFQQVLFYDIQINVYV